MKITNLLTPKSEFEIKIDLQDLDSVCANEGFAYIKTLKCKDIKDCINEIKNFKYTPKGVLINFNLNPQISLEKVESFMEIIYEISHPESDIIFSTTTTDNEEIEIEIIFTGLEI